jgi:hypothetical protein
MLSDVCFLANGRTGGGEKVRKLDGDGRVFVNGSCFLQHTSLSNEKM